MYFNHDIKLYDIDSVLNDIGKSRTPLGRVIIYVRQMNYYNDLNLMFLWDLCIVKVPVRP